MDRSAEAEAPVTVVVADSGESGQPIRRMVRRRLVQSTLFPQKSPECIKSGGEKKRREDEECNGDHKDVEDRDEEENCRSSQGKKRKAARKAKASNSHSRTPKKSKGMSSADSTPKKNETTNGIDLREDKDITPPCMPNVRLEAKMADEEYSQKYSGKQLHPFFSLWKGSKRHQAIGDVLRGSDQATAPPIHVFETDEDDAASLDWSNWELHDKPFVDSACTVEDFFTLRSEASTDPLLFRRSPFVPRMDLSCRSVADNNVTLDQYLPQGELLNEESAVVFTVSSDVHQTCCHLAADKETDCKPDESGLYGAQGMGESIEKSGVLHHERVMPHGLDGEGQVDNRLWTDKYQPEMAREVCSNIEAVNFVNEWLHSWHRKGDGATKAYSIEIDSDEQDTDYFCSQSDSENTIEVGSHKPVLLITGPAGSGKSAAIYACAREQGYKILEVSTSECRNGAGVKRRFGEALESQFLKRSLESPVKPQGHFKKFSFTHQDYEVMQEHENKVIDLESKSDKQNTDGLTETCGKFDNATKTLILFEDVDVVFPEDAGFISAIQQIADNAKGPVILTSNSDNPVLPDKLDRLHVNFKMPTVKDLLQHIYKVCSSEKADAKRHIIEQIVECCHGDIRKAIMHAQFWCQGKLSRKTGTPRLLGPLNFFPEAAHQLLPKMIPWDCPSQLSEMIDKEITRSLLKSEECYLAGRTTEEKSEAKHGDSATCGFGKDSTEAKKEAMLGRNCLEYDCNNNFTALSAAHDAFVASTSPVLFARRNSRRKHDHVVSSESEDDTENFLKLGEIPSDNMSRQIYLSRQADFQSSYRAEELKESCNQYSENAVDLHSNHIYQSIDISCVPESSFVPETKIDDDTRVSVDQVTSTLEEVSVTNGFDLNLSPVKENFDDCTSESYRLSELLGSTCNQLFSTSSHQEIEDSQTDFMGVGAREYQVMDECSRIDFNKKCPVVAAELGCLDAADMVQETWRKLLHYHSDLRHLVATEDENASAIVRLAYGMSNLVSEAEILLSKCYFPGSSELFISLSEVSDPFSWLDKQREMTSNIVHHGFDCYVDDINGLRSKMGSQDKVNLTWEMWSTGSMVEADSSLMSQDRSERMASHSEPNRTCSLSEGGGLAKSKANQSHIFGIVHSIVPLRSHSTIKGETFQDYLSALSHISRSEAYRLLEQGNCVTRRQRRRASQHYLSGGSFSLSPDQILLLDKCNTYKHASGGNCSDT